jgi:putative sigma-54 modulation protein
MTNKKITISGHHVTVTPALETKITNMITKLQKKFDHITTVHVMLKVEGAHTPTQLAEAEVFLSSQREPLFAKANSGDMYESIKKLSDKLDRQIVDHKEKLQQHGDPNHNHASTKHNQPRQPHGHTFDDNHEAE